VGSGLCGWNPGGVAVGIGAKGSKVGVYVANGSTVGAAPALATKVGVGVKVAKGSNVGVGARVAKGSIVGVGAIVAKGSNVGVAPGNRTTVGVKPTVEVRGVASLGVGVILSP
jgi:hypothetical protein